MRTRSDIRLALALAWTILSVPALAQTPFPEIWSAKYERDYKMAPGSLLVVDNRFGNVIIEGTGGDQLQLRAKLTIRGADDAAISEARSTITLHSNLTPHGRIFRTGGNEPGRQRNWAAVVDYYIRLPRTCDVAITTVSSDTIQVSNLTGSLQVQNFSGQIDIVATGAPMLVDTTNGNIVVRLNGPLREDSRLKSLNGSVAVFARKGLSFDWVAESVSGRVRASRNVTTAVEKIADRDRWVARINGGGKRILATSMTGEVLLGPLEDAPSDIRPEIDQRHRSQQSAASGARIVESVSGLLLARPSAKTFAFEQLKVTQKLNFETPMGNFIAGDIGEAVIVTGAGEIVVGRARGMLEATSHGGPVNVGVALAGIDLETHAGDIMVNSTRTGGSAETGGGNIRVRQSGGPLRLNSGGGDITVDEARGDVYARTKSGDITVKIPESVSSLTLDLRTVGGNIVVLLPPSLRGSVEATVVSSGDQTHTIDSTIGGLDIVRDMVGDRSRIRARGALNGGGPSLRIVAEDGNIQIRQTPPARSSR